MNSDAEAIEVYEQWNASNFTNKVPLEVPSLKSDWRSLNFPNKPEDMTLSLRSINKEIQFQACFTLESDFSTIVSLLTDPLLRKKWDLRLTEMEEITRDNSETALKFIYTQGRSSYEFHNTISIHKSLFTTVLNFKGKSFPNIQPKALLSFLTSSYKLEYVDQKDLCIDEKKNPEMNLKRNSSSGDIFLEELERKKALIKCTWKANFCENSKKMFITDCIEENHTLGQTFLRFIQTAESRPEEVLEKTPGNAISEACERKKLRKLCSIRKQSDLDLEFN